jgi:hypothetical protein
VNLRLWKPGQDVAVDESIIRFTGRANEITIILNKPTPTGIKVWSIAQRGYTLQTNWHRLGSKFGPVRVEVLCKLEGNKTQAVVLYLLKKLPPASYYVTLNNLFVSNKLLKVLRSRGFAATGTCRTNAGVILELINIKKNDKGPDELPWGTLILMPTTSGLVCQIGWKDNAFAFAMSTVFNGKEKVTQLQKRPKKTLSKAKTAYVLFGD